MFVTILGCSRVGCILAESLAVEGHNVTIVDKDEEALKELGEGFNGRIVEGLGIDEDTLRRAGIEEADIFVAASSEDSINIMAAQIAKKIFKVKRVVARVYKGELNDFYESQGIEIIHPSKDAADRIKNQMLYPKFEVIGQLSEERLILLRVVANKTLANKRIGDLHDLSQARVLHMKRNGQNHIPLPYETIQERDILIISIMENDIKALEKLM